MAQQAAWVARAGFAWGLAALAALGLAIALIAPWCKLHYDHEALCEVDRKACHLEVEFALVSLCITTPTERICKTENDVARLGERPENSVVKGEGQDSESLAHCAHLSKILLFVALGLHGIVIVIFIVLFSWKYCAGHPLGRRCGLRSAACAMLVSAILSSASLILFSTRMVACFQVYISVHVERIFGVLAEQEEYLNFTMRIAPVAAFAALLFDVVGFCLTFPVGSHPSQQLHAFGQEGAVLPFKDAIDLANLGNSGPQYAAVPSEEPYFDPLPDPHERQSRTAVPFQNQITSKHRQFTGKIGEFL